MKLAVSSLIFLITAGPAFAESIYPTQIASRLVGADQVREGSCQTEAETGAFEQTFANNGWPVGLSAFYRHAKTYQDTPASQIDASVHLNYSSDDLAILRANGGVLPDYMWPEDLTLIKEKYFLGTIRPSISSQAVIDPAYPSGGSDGFNRAFYSYQPGYSNSLGSLEQVKAFVRQRLPVVMSLQSNFLEQTPGTGQDIFDPVTGLMQVPYDQTLRDYIHQQPINHAVTVVGFDDDLGALIIRNSWNSADTVEANLNTKTLEPARKADLAKLKLKLAPIPLPGYYAFPYAYFNDLMAWHAEGGVYVLSMNYDFFFKKYDEFKPHYKVFALPFSCNRSRTLEFLKTYKRRKDIIADPATEPAELKKNRRLLYTMLQEQTSIKNRVFSFAKVAYDDNLPNVDRVAEFYGGKFNSYYCGGSFVPGMFPQNGDFNAPITASSHPGWLDDAALSQSQMTLWDSIFSWMIREQKL